MHLSAQQGKRQTLVHSYNLTSEHRSVCLLHSFFALFIVPLNHAASACSPDQHVPILRASLLKENARHVVKLQDSSRGGRPECTGRHRRYNDSTLRDGKEYALRDSFIEAAFKQPLDLVRGNSVAFVEAVIHVLRKHGGVQTDNDYVAIMNDIVFEPGSKHFSYVFRRSRLPHEDGSLCLNELFNHGGTTRKIREMNSRGHKKLKTLDESQVGKNMRIRATAIYT